MAKHAGEEFVVEVNEGTAETSGRGSGWWQIYRPRLVTSGNLRVAKPACVVGGVVELSCDTMDDAEFMAEHMIHNGMPRAAIRVGKKRGAPS